MQHISNDEPKSLLTLREAARKSSRSPDTVARWCASLSIGVRDERGRWRVDPTKLDALIEARRVLGLDESAEADSEQDRNRSGGPKQRGGAVMAHLPVDREQIAQFVKTVFRHASAGQTIWMRAFGANKRPFEIKTIRIDGQTGLDPVIELAVQVTRFCCKVRFLKVESQSWYKDSKDLRVPTSSKN